MFGFTRIINNFLYKGFLRVHQFLLSIPHYIISITSLKIIVRDDHGVGVVGDEGSTTCF